MLSFSRSILFGFVILFALTSCGGSGGGGDDDEAVVDPIVLDFVLALFEAEGADWNDYVVGEDFASATGDGCNAGADPACVHGGEHRAVKVNGRSSCVGLSATDALGAFDWICAVDGGSAWMISSGLADGKYLSDLIDFTTPGFLDNAVTVFENGVAQDTTASTPWWNNPVVVNMSGGSLAEPSTIYLLTGDPATNYTIDAHKVALVVQSPFTLTGPGSFTEVVSASGVDYLWLEGAINAIGDNIGIEFDSVNFSVLSNVSVENSDNYGIRLRSASNNRLSDVTASFNSFASLDIDNSSNNVVSGVTATNNGAGIRVTNSSSNTLSGVTASNNGSGVFLFSASNNTLSGVTASNNNSDGVFLFQGTNNNTLSGVTANNNGTNGVLLIDASNNTLSGVTASTNGSVGVSIIDASNNTLSGVTASNNDSQGVFLVGFLSNNNSFVDVVADNNGSDGFLIVGSISRVSINNLNASNNALNGIWVDSVRNSQLSNITASNNGERGVRLQNSADLMLAGLTVNNHSLAGLELDTTTNSTILGVTAANQTPFSGIDIIGASTKNTFHALAARNNGFAGLRLATASNNLFSDLASANNGAEGIHLISASNNVFTGLLEVGNNFFVDCSVTAGSNTGLTNVTCISDGGLSNHLVIEPVDLSGSLVGRVTSDDARNISDIGGGVIDFPVDPDTFDWSRFDNAFRGWGVDTAPFRQRWTAGAGRIWDWSVASTDNGAAPAGCASPPCPALLRAAETEAGGIPDGDDTFTHTWSDLSTTTFLRDAVEISGDGIGNDNTLCESAETCLHMPNIGSYQGHGNLVSTGAFVDGTPPNGLIGITLLRYANNGR